jgi:hypothetical protein
MNGVVGKPVHAKKYTHGDPSLIVVHANVVSGTAGISTLKAASDSKSSVTPSNNGQLMESAYLPTTTSYAEDREGIALSFYTSRRRVRIKPISPLKFTTSRSSGPLTSSRSNMIQSALSL